MDKKTLRQLAKEKRKNLCVNCDLLVEKIVQTDEYKCSKNIMIFYPLKNEVNLLSLLKDKTKTFYLPKVCGQNLLCCPYSEGDELCISVCKTLEPKTESCDKDVIDLVVVPALCCDRKNYRLGYGGGYYDRFLQDYKGKTIVCLPKELIVETVYPEEHDIFVDRVITD